MTAFGVLRIVETTIYRIAMWETASQNIFSK
jgi:hypothetical protein